MFKFFENRIKGFSMIEMLVYIAILAFMLVIIVGAVISITSSSRVISSTRNIENSAALGMERITRELRLADNVNLSTSVLGTHPGVLVLNGVDDNGIPRTAEFYLSNNRIILKEDGIDVGVLTEPDAQITSLIFRRFATSTIEGIRTEMVVESGTSTHYRSETFYSSAIIR